MLSSFRFDLVLAIPTGTRVSLRLFGPIESFDPDASNRSSRAPYLLEDLDRGIVYAPARSLRLGSIDEPPATLKMAADELQARTPTRTVQGTVNACQIFWRESPRAPITLLTIAIAAETGAYR